MRALAKVIIARRPSFQEAQKNISWSSFFIDGKNLETRVTIGRHQDTQPIFNLYPVRLLHQVATRWHTLKTMDQTSLHENLDRRQEGQGGSNRGFGIVFAIFFTLMGLLPLRAHHSVRWWALASAGLFLGVALLQPTWLHALNQLWTQLGLLLGRVFSPVVTALLFFAVVTPIGLIFRLLKKDPLHLASSTEMPTYWIARQPPGPSPETMRNQF